MMRTPKSRFLLHGREPYETACALLILSFFFFYLFRISTPLNVDTYLYARAIRTFEGPSVHFGYYIMGAMCHFLLKPLGVTPLETLGYMSHFFGAVCVGGIYVFTFLLTNNRLQSLLTAAILMFSGAFWLFSIHGEVYVPQLAFVLFSLIFLLKNRSVLSSLSILAAISITPTSFLGLIPLGYIVYIKHMGKKAVFYFTMPILITFSVLMSWNGSKVFETFADAVYSPKAFVEPFSYSKILSLIIYKIIRAYGNSFNLISFFAIFGFVILYRDNKRLWGLIVAFLVPFLAYFFNLGLLSGDHLIISFIPVSFLGGYGIFRLLETLYASRKTRIIFVTLLLCFHIWITHERSISRHRAYAEEFGRVIHVLLERFPSNGIMLTDFDLGKIFFSMLGKDYPYPLLDGDPSDFLMERDLQGRDAVEMLKGGFWLKFRRLLEFVSRPEFRSLVDERPIYFAERKFWPIGMIQLYSPLRELFGIKEKEETGRPEKIREYLAYKLNADVTLDKIIESPLYPVYVMKAK